MKRFKVFLSIAALLVIIAAGCNKNDSVMGPNGSNVSFQISQQNGFNGVEFLFTPSADTKITKIVSRYPAQQFADTVTFGNPNYTYSKDTIYIISEYIGVAAGQQWQFDFSGANYNTTANYTVQ